MSREMALMIAGALVASCLPDGLVDADGDTFSSEEDCDDGDPRINPDAVERCGDAIDEDCDGATDEGFDEDEDGFLTCLVAGSAADCDDDDEDIRPDAEEVCGDGVDNDCDGVADTLVDEFEPNNTQATAAFLGVVDNDVLSVSPTVYLSDGPDARDFFLIETTEDDPSDGDAFTLTVSLTHIPEGVDLDLTVQPLRGGGGGSDSSPGNTDEEVILKGTRADDSGTFVIEVKLMNKSDEPGVNCLPYLLTVVQQG